MANFKHPQTELESYLLSEILSTKALLDTDKKFLHHFEDGWNPESANLLSIEMEIYKYKNKVRILQHRLNWLTEQFHNFK